MTSCDKQQNNPEEAHSKHNDPPARPISGCHRHNNMNFAVWYHMKRVLSFLVFSVLWTLLDFAIGAGFRIVSRLSIKISISIRVIKVVNWLYYFSVLCIGFIRGRLKTKTDLVQNRYARWVLTCIICILDSYTLSHTLVCIHYEVTGWISYMSY